MKGGLGVWVGEEASMAYETLRFEREGPVGVLRLNRPEAMELARKMASKSPLGLRLTKEAMDQNFGASTLEDALRPKDRNQAMCIAQPSAARDKG